MVCLGPSLVSRGRRSSARNTAIQDHCRRPKVFFHRQNIFIERLDDLNKSKTVQEMSDEVKQTVQKLIAEKHLEMTALQDFLAKINTQQISALAADDPTPPQDSSSCSIV